MFKAKLCPIELRAVKKGITRFSQEVTRQRKQLPRRWAIEFAKRFKQAIMTNRYETDVPPLNAKYVKWKFNKGYDTHAWRMELNLLASISSWRRDPYSFWAGVPAGVPGSRDSYVGKYACIAEYGSTIWEGGNQRQPPRPYMQPEFKLFLQDGYKGGVVSTLKMLQSKWRRVF